MPVINSQPKSVYTGSRNSLKFCDLKIRQHKGEDKHYFYELLGQNNPLGIYDDNKDLSI